ncbi:C-C chemokine receptor type 2-like [Puntigrus tetrazona]|uniref:C-C chemokine receptor type 2-like n=1 Tax=Puntigrus tetrazona TaxID=1606681 RepID=UPI001C8AAF94|nr:C-C chemokine receptor type 2-like [Puntigrus tetrazona]XP_043087754.1 C-C chemokine receptor type 2-like [Puntigrus tetrazona]XP_043114497.1 C-C chemokine receptor type 2-like [Puntigrus tetrazona]
MNNFTVNFTIPETSTNCTTQCIGLMDCVEIGVYSISFLFGFPTHAYVIWLIVKESGVTTEFFNLNLSVCEIINRLNSLVSILSICFANLTIIPLVLQGLVFTGCSLFQSLICVERYLAVVHPITFLKFKPLRYRVICSVVCWIITLGSCLCCMLIVLSLKIHAYTWFFSQQFLLFFSIQLFCLVAVLRALKQSGPGKRLRERNEENHMKRRAFYIILITTGSMTIMHVPFTITGFLTFLTRQNIHVLWNIGLTFYVLAGFVQPVLYLHRTGKFSYLCYS